MDAKHVMLFGEYDLPKENIEPYMKLIMESSKAFSGFAKEGIIKEYMSWTDNTNHYVICMLFESIEKFAELWNKDEFHKYTSESSVFLENVRFRLLRPALMPKS